MNQEKIFFNAILSECTEKPCSIRTSVLPSGLIKKEGHILIQNEDGKNVVLFFSSIDDMVEIAAVTATNEDWNKTENLVTIPWFFEKFQDDNVVPVYMWKHDWSIIHIKLENLMEAIDFILS